MCDSASLRDAEGMAATEGIRKGHCFDRRSRAYLVSERTGFRRKSREMISGTPGRRAAKELVNKRLRDDARFTMVLVGEQRDNWNRWRWPKHGGPLEIGLI